MKRCLPRVFRDARRPLSVSNLHPRRIEKSPLLSRFPVDNWRRRSSSSSQSLASSLPPFRNVGVLTNRVPASFHKRNVQSHWWASVYPSLHAIFFPLKWHFPILLRLVGLHPTPLICLNCWWFTTHSFFSQSLLSATCAVYLYQTPRSWTIGWSARPEDCRHDILECCNQLPLQGTSKIVSFLLAVGLRQTFSAHSIEHVLQTTWISPLQSALKQWTTQVDGRRLGWRPVIVTMARINVFFWLCGVGCVCVCVHHDIEWETRGYRRFWYGWRRPAAHWRLEIEICSRGSFSSSALEGFSGSLDSH